MSQKIARNENPNFGDTLVSILRKVDYGGITISKQNGKVTHLGVKEKRKTLHEYSKRTNEIKKGVTVSPDELSDLIAYINDVEYGKVFIEVKDSEIIGVEKDESVQK